jgi:hypothetical protein
MEWLNTNAGAVQAMSSVLIAMLTVFLVCVTYRYMRLTRVLAEAATEQLRSQREAAHARQTELAAEIEFWRAELDSFPQDSRPAQQEQEREHALALRDYDFSGFIKLASEVGYLAGTEASRFKVEIRKLFTQLNQARDTNPEFPSFHNFAWGTFYKRRITALTCLNSIETGLKAKLAGQR